MKSVVVITPTTGADKIKDAILSVAAQTYPNVKHLIVIDGLEFESDFSHVMEKVYQHHDVDPTVIQLNDNVGANGFYGHRIYAAFSHLVKEDIVCFLDQDNTYEPNHVETLVNKIEKNDLLWAYSLRNIYDKDGNFLCKDDCESLGKWPVWNNKDSYHVDTSSYAFRREFLIKVASLWHQGYGGDRIFFNLIKQNFAPNTFDCSGHYSLNYYLDGNPKSADPAFFNLGNDHMRNFYGMLRQEFPWRIQ